MPDGLVPEREQVLGREAPGAFLIERDDVVLRRARAVDDRRREAIGHATEGELVPDRHGDDETVDALVAQVLDPRGDGGG